MRGQLKAMAWRDWTESSLVGGVTKIGRTGVWVYCYIVNLFCNVLNILDQKWSISAMTKTYSMYKVARDWQHLF